MTPLIEIEPCERCAKWMSIDLTDDEDVGCPVVIPLFGPDHRAGLDCWCHPELDDYGVIVHEAAH